MRNRVRAIERKQPMAEGWGVFVIGSGMSAEEWDLVAPLAQALLVKETLQGAESVPVPGPPTQRL
jgi:hypothetical protein